MVQREREVDCFVSVCGTSVQEGEGALESDDTDATDEGAGSREAIDGAKGDRPPAVDQKPEDADDLTLMSGVGPKIAGLLHDIGIYKFDQIAAWTPGQCAWVNDSLKLGGRIERDEWVRQAGVLAKGGIEEYEKVFGRTAR